MGLRKKLAHLSAAAITALSPMKSEGSTTDKEKLNANSKELILNKDTEKNLQQESKSLVDAIKNGEKVTHGSIVLDMQKLKQLKSKGELKDFEIVFEGEKVGLKFHDDGKRGAFTKDVEAKTYMVLMPRRNFEIFLAAMLRKEMKEEVKEQPQDPNTWVFENTFPEFLVIDKDGNRNTMTNKKDSQNMYTKLTDTFCKMNSEGVINVGEIVSGYKPEIKEFGGWIGEMALELIGSSSWAQNRLIQNVIKPWFEDNFVDLALNSSKKRDRALEEFNKEKEEAIRKYQEEHDPVFIAAREQRRLSSLVPINKIDRVLKVENKKGESSLDFLYKDTRVIIATKDGMISNSAINYFVDGNSVWRKIEPEELKDIASSIKNLSDEQKAVLGENFFKTIQEEADIQMAEKDTKLNPSVLAAFSGKKTR